MTRLLLVLLALSLILAGCGSTSTPAASPPANTPPPPGGGTGPLTNPTIISINGGTASGVDINVAAPVGTAPNAQDLGVASLGSGGGSANNTGAQIHRGASMHVLLFGPGLSGNMQVRLSGPQDYSIANPISISSTNNTPGIEFDLTMNGDAALGARTVILIGAQNNVTTFTGGLEVLP